MAAPPVLLATSDQPLAFTCILCAEQVAVGGAGPLNEPQATQNTLAALAARRLIGWISR
jgi:hypothetical protein